jgi:hypothetical protein
LVNYQDAMSLMVQVGAFPAQTGSQGAGHGDSKAFSEKQRRITDVVST